MDSLEKILLGGDEGIAWLSSQGVHLDDSTPVKKVLDWHGFKIGLQYLPFEKRFGKMLRAGYGHFQVMKGTDGMAVDVYVGIKLESDKVFAIAQVVDGVFDEEKLVVGVDNQEEATEIYLSAMPKEFFGGIREIGIAGLEKYQAKRRNGEEVRRDYLAGIISKDEARSSRGYEVHKKPNHPPAFAENLESWNGEKVYAIAHNYGGVLAVNYESKEEAEREFKSLFPGIEIEINDVTSLVQEEYKTDGKSSKFGSGSKKRVKGNLCRDANGKFVPCGIVTEE